LPSSAPRRRLLPLAILAAGGLVAAYFLGTGPREQHVRLVLGGAASAVTALSVQYTSPAGEALRDVRLTFPEGRAPRVVALDPRLPDGDVRLRIDVDTREGRRTTERQVTLGGGTTSVNLDDRTAP
jgi:hypothetical protein